VRNAKLPSYEELKRRLDAAESALKAIREGRVDTILGEREPLVVRLAETEAREAHLKQVLSAIRNVNQLIVAEDDPQRLIAQACVNLIETMGYHNAWIALLGGEAARGLGLPPEGPVAAAAAAGFDGGFEILRERLERGQFPECMQRAMENQDTLVKDDPAVDCPDCPLHGQYGGRAGLVRRLHADGVTYGILTASVPAAYARTAEEQDLFNEVAGDLAFALNKIAAARKLEENRRYLALVIEGSGMGTWEWNVRTNETLFNAQWAAALGYTLEELTPYDYATWEGLVHPEDLGRARRALADCLEGRTADYSCEYRMQHKDGRWVWILDRGRVMIRDDAGKALSMFGTHTDIADLKQTEEALGRQYAMLARTEAIAHVGSWEWDIAGDHVHWSDEMFRIFGRDPNAGAPSFARHSEIYLPEDMQRLSQAVERCKSRGTPYELDLRAVRPDGEIRYCVAWGRAETDATGRIVRLAGVILDITERKRAEEALRKSEKKWRSYVQNAPFGVFITDVDGRYVEVNPAACEITGYSEEELLTMSIPDLMPPGSEQENLSHFQRLRDTGFSGGTVGLLHRNGQVRRWSVSAVKLAENRFLGFAEDVTERELVAESLRQSEERFRAANEASLDALLLLRSERDETGEISDFIFVDVNRRTEEMLRMRRDQLLGKRLCETLPVNREAGFFEKYKRVVDTGAPLEEEFFLPEAHVPAVWYYHQVVKVHDGVFICHRDISDRKRAEAEHEKLQTQLRQAQKMEAVGRLAGGVAHDFNNMLGIIIGHADMVLEEMGADQPFYADLVEIRKAGVRSADLTRQLLAFARKQTVAPRVIDLNKTVGGMLKMLQRLIGEDIDMAWIPGEKVWPVKIDPGQVDQILANLCVNARDAIADVGKVTIETGNIVFDEDYCRIHAGFVPGEYAMLAVSDNGCGMDAETLAYVFEPFYTTKELGKGTGLGLATVYGVVKQNKGLINVYSEPGQGTTFKIYLPRHLPETTRFSEKRSNPPAERGRETVLLVEDEPAILRMTALMLKREGYTVVGAGTPGEAIHLATENPGEIHLLMTDVVMPEMNGRDLAKNILSLYPRLKCLFMSGYTANVIAHHGVLDEGVHFIQKPFSKAELAAKVREALDQTSAVS